MPEVVRAVSAAGALALGLAALAALAPAGPATAHTTSLATSEVRVSGARVDYRLRVSAHDLAVALGIETDLVTPIPRSAFEHRAPALASYLRERLGVTAQGSACVPAPAVVDHTPLPDEVTILVRHECPVSVERLGLRYALFLDLDPGHRSLGRVVLPAGEIPFVFDRSMRDLDLDLAGVGAGRPGARFRRVFALGVDHILGGHDHLLFLLALLVASTGFWPTVRVVSAFTVGHSLTLALAWQGSLVLPARPVEVAIAASIAYVAVENMLRRPAGRRWIVAGLFGLVHGLGFYGNLRDAGLAGAEAVTTLLAFNLGVEAGQVAVVAAAWGLLVWCSRRAWYATAVRACSAVILALALWWIVQRGAVG